MGASGHLCPGETAMSKINKNDPCSCGSGRKYKRCCQTKDRPKKPSKPGWDISKRSMPKNPDPFGFFKEDRLTHESNRVVDLIHEGRLDEAELAAQKLLEDFPEVPDGLERLATVYETRGDKNRAVTLYRQALELILNDDGYDEETRDYYRSKISKLEQDIEEQSCK
jgi:tetratricopeptide (TPR) repeat protein